MLYRIKPIVIILWDAISVKVIREEIKNIHKNVSLALCLVLSVCLFPEKNLKRLPSKTRFRSSHDWWNIDNINLHFVLLRALKETWAVIYLLIMFIAFFEMITADWVNKQRQHLHNCSSLSRAFFFSFLLNFIMDLSYRRSPCMKLHFFTELLLTASVVWQFKEKATWAEFTQIF